MQHSKINVFRCYLGMWWENAHYTVSPTAQPSPIFRVFRVFRGSHPPSAFYLLNSIFFPQEFTDNFEGAVGGACLLVEGGAGVLAQLAGQVAVGQNLLDCQA
jgi:hypothetical protein